MTKNIDLGELKRKYSSNDARQLFNPKFQKVAEKVFSRDGTRRLPYAGIRTFLDAPYRPFADGFDSLDLDVALIGIPLDLGVTNRPGARFGPRAIRAMERIGPYNHVLDCTPIHDLRVADIGDVAFQSRYDLEQSHEDIKSFMEAVVGQGIIPLSVGGDHSISQSILKVLGKKHPVGMIHIDAHCDTGGPFEGTKFHHGGPFRNAVLEGVLDPARTIQIGIRGSAEYIWEFSYESGMTVIHAEEITKMGVEGIIEKARSIVGDGETYVSFDIDSLDPSFAPGTGTPEVGGLTTREALQLLRGMKGINIVGGDVVEVAPQYDPGSNTAQAAAQILFEILSLVVFKPERAS